MKASEKYNPFKKSVSLLSTLSMGGSFFGHMRFEFVSVLLLSLTMPLETFMPRLLVAVVLLGIDVTLSFECFLSMSVCLTGYDPKLSTLPLLCINI